MLSIFAASDGRFSNAGSVTKRPVRGAMGGSVVVVVAMVVTAGAFFLSPPQAAARTISTTGTTTRARRLGRIGRKRVTSVKVLPPEKD